MIPVWHKRRDPNAPGHAPGHTWQDAFLVQVLPHDHRDGTFVLAIPRQPYDNEPGMKIIVETSSYLVRVKRTEIPLT